MVSNERFEYFSPASGCLNCPDLVKSRRTVVWGKGPGDADIMLIGESPGWNEDGEGKPFVGYSGRKQDGYLKQAGIDPFSVHFANVLMCHPTGDRDPMPEELDNCRPWLVEHIRSVNPKGVILVGKYALASKFGPYKSVGAHQGLMYRTECDACGELDGQHGDRWAGNGKWIENDPLRRCRHGAFLRRRVYAATYHPANRDPDTPQQIVREMQRLRLEVERAR